MFRTTLRRLEVFVAAVEAGGFRACSDQLDISQAAVSHHVRQLEDELGYPLFVRQRGSAAGVTRQGATAYRQAKGLLDEALGLEGLKRDATPTRRRLSVQADQILDAVLARRIAGHVCRDPAVDVSLRQSCFEEMVQSYNKGEADIVYFYADGPVAEIESDLCWSEPVSICAGEDHPIHREGPVALEAVARHSFLAPLRGSHFRRSVDRMLIRQGLPPYPVALEVDHASLAREAVIGGQAVSAVITRYLDEELSRFGVREVPLKDAKLSLQVRRAMRPQLFQDRIAGRLTDALEHDGARRPPCSAPVQLAAAL